MVEPEYMADLHTHTIASGHAYNTIQEMIKAAENKGLKLYGITEHSVTMPGTCNNMYFSNLRNVRRSYEGIEVLFGVELNIISYDGDVDMSEELLKEMDVVIASIHANIGYTSGTVEENTRAVIGAIKNPLINIIGHPDDGRIPLNYEQVVKAAKEYETLLEINNSSLAPAAFRVNARENDEIMLKLCHKYRVPVIIGSDAHSDDAVAANERALGLMKYINFDMDLVMNYNIDELKKYLNKYRNNKT